MDKALIKKTAVITLTIVITLALANIATSVIAKGVR